VYCCFDLRHDADLLARLVQDAKHADSPFEVVAWSGRHAATPDWEGQLRGRLAGVDAVIVICGEHGDTADEMSAELQVVREQAKPYFLLWGRRGASCTKPVAARPADSFYSWIWGVLKWQVGQALRGPPPAGGSPSP
jgi:hypothetical protein